MSYAITLTTQDDKQFTFRCEAGQTLLQAAEAVNLFLPAVCNTGSCGACLAQCQKGQYQMDSYAPGALPDNAAETGDLLLCRTHPDSNLRLTTLYHSSQIRDSALPSLDGEIITLEMAAERTVHLEVRVEAENGFYFEAGQYVELEVPGMGLKRAYSIANTQSSNGVLEFFIRLQPKGLFSTFLEQQAHTGQKLNIAGPSGDFGQQADDGMTPRCFVAGGAGLAPFLSILRNIAESGEDSPIHLIFGVNREEELFCLEQLQELEECIPHLSVQLCVVEPSESWQGFRGTSIDGLQAYLAGSNGKPGLFLCGPAPMVDAALPIALIAGIGQQQIFCERFA